MLVFRGVGFSKTEDFFNEIIQKIHSLPGNSAFSCPFWDGYRSRIESPGSCLFQPISKKMRS